MNGLPRYVPTLTEVLEPPLLTEPAFIHATEQVVTSADTHDLLIQRVLRRVDQVLESRLHEAIERLILEQAQALMPHLREEIRQAIRQSINQAFEQEFSSDFDPRRG